MQEASKEFNDLLDEFLISIGFQPTKADPCLYVHEHPVHGKTFAAVHVDDILLLSPNVQQRTWVENTIKSKYQIKIQHDKISYLGMSIERDPDTHFIKVSQHGYIKDLLQKHGSDKLSKFPRTPASPSLCVHDSNSPSCDKTKFLSLTMSLMYLARFTRADILMPVSYLATRSSNPTVEDYSKLMRIVKYVAGTKDTCLTFKPTDMILKVYADASHNMHSDGRGQAGIIITLGSAPIFSRSFKIKSTTRSSTESELVALEDSTTYVVWLRCLL
jgi:hypothetical protein